MQWHCCCQCDLCCPCHAAQVVAAASIAPDAHVLAAAYVCVCCCQGPPELRDVSEVMVWYYVDPHQDIQVGGALTSAAAAHAAALLGRCWGVCGGCLRPLLLLMLLLSWGAAFAADNAANALLPQHVAHVS
jgi:hypothetical protein